MAKRKLSTTRLDLDLFTSPNIDWSKCFICQTQKREKVVCPALSKRSDFGKGYETFVEDVTCYNRHAEHKFHLDEFNKDRKSDTNVSFLECLKQNSAKWHSSCRLGFSKSKLRRLENKKRFEIGQSSAQNEEARHDVNDCNKDVCRKSRLRTDGTLASNRQHCIFCEMSSETERLHAITTTQAECKIRNVAELIGDSRMIAFMSFGDLIAQEAHYHRLCYLKYLNKARARETDGYLRTEEKISLAESQALAEVIFYIKVNSHETHKLRDLIERFVLECNKRGVTDMDTHVSRFKDRILHQLPHLQSFTKPGRDGGTMLSFHDKVATDLERRKDQGTDDDEITLRRAASILRREIDKKRSNQENLNITSFMLDAQEDSVPTSLLKFVKLLLVGPGMMKSTLRQQESLSISQLIVTNTVQNISKKSKEDILYKRYSLDRETPLPLYIGILLYTSTRSQKLITTLFSLGLCVSYKRLICLSDDIVKSLKKRFSDDDAVCPLPLRKSLFTLAAFDNIDHNTSSSSSRKSFHGTGISIFQSLSAANEGTKRDPLERIQQNCNIAKESSVLSRFLYVEQDLPRLESTAPALPECVAEYQINPQISQVILPEVQWVETVGKSFSDDTNVQKSMTWTAFHAQNSCPNIKQANLQAMLPLLDAPSKSVGTVVHVVKTITHIINFLNPGQIPVIAADQPLYALAKQIQWTWPEQFGEGKLVIMLGGLHLEAEMMKCIGKLLHSSGWISLIAKAGICGLGTAESFLNVSHIKRTRYAHQVTSACLSLLQNLAFETSKTTHNFQTWCEEQRQLSILFFFWDLIKKMEFLLHSFLRSQRTSNFKLYLEVLDLFCRFFFALDKTNYMKWVPVHIRDMRRLPITAPAVFKEFISGNFTICKSKRPFSEIALDHAHEQNNQLVKGSLNVISLAERPETLARWMLCTPQFISLKDEFESSIPGLAEHQALRHDEESLAKQKLFRKDLQNLCKAFNESIAGNPFSSQRSENSLIDIESGKVAGSAIEKDIRRIECLGEEQYAQFVAQRLTSNALKFHEKIRLNKLKLMSVAVQKGRGALSMKMKELKADLGLFSKLFISCQTRKSSLDDFFAFENHPYPPALSSGGCIRPCPSKSQLLPCLLDNCNQDPCRHPISPVLIVDGAFIVQLMLPKMLMTFKQYAVEVFIKKILSDGEKADRIDVVFDQYLPLSIKSQERRNRGTSSETRICLDSKVPTNWRDFLKNEANKTSLFKLLAEVLVTEVKDKLVFATYGHDIISNQRALETQLSPCHQEEADTRMFLHVLHASRNGYDIIKIRSTDTDVIVIGISLFEFLKVQELWVAYGTGKSFKNIPVHEIYSSLGPERSHALLFFHAFTGCDSVSSFNGIGKKTAWDVWEADPTITIVFKSLACFPDRVTSSHMTHIERFTTQLYDRNCESTNVDETRKLLFSRKGRSAERIPPTRCSLLQHTKRACYQAGYIWANSLMMDEEIPSPLLWGWQLDKTGSELIPFWTAQPEASAVCRNLLKCGCVKKACLGSCKCKKANLACTELCACGGNCRSN